MEIQVKPLNTHIAIKNEKNWYLKTKGFNELNEEIR